MSQKPTEPAVEMPAAKEAAPTKPAPLKNSARRRNAFPLDIALALITDNPTPVEQQEPPVLAPTMGPDAVRVNALLEIVSAAGVIYEAVKPIELGKALDPFHASDALTEFNDYVAALTRNLRTAYTTHVYQVLKESKVPEAKKIADALPQYGNMPIRDVVQVMTNKLPIPEQLEEEKDDAEEN